MNPIISSYDEPDIFGPSSYNENQFKIVIVERGDVVFMSYFTLHRSGCNGLTSNIRIAHSTRFDN